MKARGPGQSALLLLDVAARLAEEKIDYAVIGAMAASVHGSIRATRDADALLSITIPRLGTLEKTFRRMGFQTKLSRGDADDPIPALLAITDRFENRVDLLAGLRNLDPDVFSRSLTVQFFKTAIRVVSREDFIAMKCFAGGLQDIVDAREAMRAGDEPLDIDLLRRVTRRFGREAADHLEQLLAA